MHHQYLTKIFIKIVLSVSIHSPPSLKPRPERGWVTDIAKCPFGIHPSDTKAFIQSQACLHRVSLNRLCQQSPRKPPSHANPGGRHDWAQSGAGLVTDAQNCTAELGFWLQSQCSFHSTTFGTWLKAILFVFK